LALEHYKLLTQGEILKHQSLAGAKQAKNDANPKPQMAEHGLSS